jgi:GntR family transcriptional regulator
MSPIKEGGSEPLYLQVKQALQRDIEREMHPGQALPAEPELEKRFGVSRITIRRALDELESEGLIIRRQGRGTFVREPPIMQEMSTLFSWTYAMRRMGYEIETRRCEIDLIEPSRELSSWLQLALQQRVVRIRRLRYAAGAPVCLMTNYLPEGLIPDLLEQGLRHESLYTTLVEHQLIPVHAADRVEARAATAWEAELLQIAPQSPLLQVTRISYDAGGHPLDVAVVSSRADRYSYIGYTSIQGNQGTTPVYPSPWQQYRSS